MQHHDIQLGIQYDGFNEIPVHLSMPDRRAHVHIVGKTGTGKSTLLRNLILQDIEAGHGVAIIDPHGDLARSLLDAIPSRRIQDKVYFDAGDTEFPVAWNLLKCEAGSEGRAIFSTAIHAHFVATLVALYCLYETRKDTYNIPQLLRRSKTESKFTPEEIAEFEILYARAKPLWAKVCVLRNKAFGHRSISLTVEEAFAEANVTPNEFSELIEVTKQLLNTVSRAYDGSSHVFNLSTQKDVIQMLDELSST